MQRQHALKKPLQNRLYSELHTWYTRTTPRNGWGAFVLLLFVLGPELRQGLELFRVVNRTGLQIRKDIALDSEPCGRLYAGDVFCVNDSSTVLHHSDSRRPGKREKRGMVRLTRLHMVAPRIGWVSGSSKWVSKFQEGGRPGPIPLRSTLSDNCPVAMVKPPESGSTARSRSTAKVEGRSQEGGVSTLIEQEPAATTPRTRWLHSR